MKIIEIGQGSPAMLAETSERRACMAAALSAIESCHDPLSGDHAAPLPYQPETIMGRPDEPFDRRESAVTNSVLLSEDDKERLKSAQSWTLAQAYCKAKLPSAAPYPSWVLPDEREQTAVAPVRRQRTRVVIPPIVREFVQYQRGEASPEARDRVETALHDEHSELRQVLANIMIRDDATKE
jgi:hypothetical protein